MQRRDFIKNIGLSLGVLSVAPLDLLVESKEKLYTVFCGKRNISCIFEIYESQLNNVKIGDNITVKFPEFGINLEILNIEEKV